MDKRELAPRQRSLFCLESCSKTVTCHGRQTSWQTLSQPDAILDTLSKTTGGKLKQDFSYKWDKIEEIKEL